MSSGMLSNTMESTEVAPPPSQGRLGLKAFQWVLRLGLASVFIAAAFHKVIDPGSFAVAIHRFDLLPPSLIQPAALMLPWLEVVAAIALLTTRSWRIAGAWLLLGLLVVFTAAAASAKWRGLNISCGCFSSDNPSPIGWWLFIRNAGLMLANGAVLWLDGQVSSRPDRRR